MSIVTVWHNPAARSGGSMPSIAVVISLIPVSTARHWVSVNRFASPAAVVDAQPGTGANACPAVSARGRSDPTKKSSPANCADVIPTTNSPPV